MYALAQEHTTLAVALRNAIENNAWHETAVVGGKLLAIASHVGSCLKDLDAQLVDTMFKHNAEEVAALTGKYQVQRTNGQLVADAESAVAAAAKALPHIDASRIVAMLRGEGQAVKPKK